MIMQLTPMQQPLLGFSVYFKIDEDIDSSQQSVLRLPFFAFVTLWYILYLNMIESSEYNLGPNPNFHGQ